MSKRKLSELHKLPARTAPEIAQAFGRLLNDLQAERRIVYNGRKISGEAMVGGIVLDFLAKSPGEQRKILERRVAEFEYLMGDPDPEDAVYEEVKFLNPPAAPAPSRRKRNA